MKVYQVPKGTIKTEELRAKMKVDRVRLWQYRKAGLFPFYPTTVTTGRSGGNKVYPEEALTQLDILESLRLHGFSIRAMRILFATMKTSEGIKDFISFDNKARLVMDAARLKLAARIIEKAIADYDRGYELSPKGERPPGKG